jgi:hypothetical protein
MIYLAVFNALLALGLSEQLAGPIAFQAWFLWAYALTHPK